jgi:hypothetical protein
MYTTVKPKRLFLKFEKERISNGRFIDYKYVPGEGIYAVFEDTEVLVTKSPCKIHQEQKELKHQHFCSKLIDKIFKEKCRIRPVIDKQNLRKHVA